MGIGDATAPGATLLRPPAFRPWDHFATVGIALVHRSVTVLIHPAFTFLACREDCTFANSPSACSACFYTKFT